MTAAQYPVGTIFEMAAIPDETLPRFLAELPDIIASLKHMLAMNSILAELGAEIVPQSPVWMDDDKRIATTTFSHDGQEIASLKVQLPPLPKASA